MTLLREVLAANHIEKRFGKFEVLRGVDFTLEEGAVCGLIGENGAGKTTLMRVLLSLMKPTAGTVLRKTGKPYVGYMPQSCRFDGRMNVEQVISFFSIIRAVPPGQSLALCDKLLLDRRKPVKTLSPGQQKKLQMTLAMMGEPDLYILDEPTAGLDPSATREMGEIIDGLRSKGKSILISSHILQDMNETCTEAAILSQGKLLCHEQLESSYLVKTAPVPPETLVELRKMYSIFTNDSGTVLRVRANASAIPGLVRVLVARDVEVLEVSAAGIKSLVQDVLGWEGGVSRAANAG
jgi:ABC-2 type transport system ATP-binding protein